MSCRAAISLLWTGPSPGPQGEFKERPDAVVRAT